jgi:hypothetical protein
LAKLGRASGLSPITALIVVKDSLPLWGLTGDTKAALSGGLCRKFRSGVGLRREFADFDVRP